MLFYSRINVYRVIDFSYNVLGFRIVIFSNQNDVKVRIIVDVYFQNFFREAIRESVNKNDLRILNGGFYYLFVNFVLVR